jgi:hypothetical protein
MVDVVSVGLAVAAALLAVVIGLQTGYSRVDVDEQVYRDTLLHMRAGQSYYPAMRDALVHDKHERPTALRSLRPPTLFILLRPLPPSSWRWVVGLVYLAVLLLAWRLGRLFGVIGGPLAVVFAAVWLLGFADYLFLHSELWGMPFFMAGVLSLRRGRDAHAAAWMTAAMFFRELFGLGLLLGLLLRRGREWLVAIAVGALALVVHAVLAQSALSPTGHDAGFGNEQRTLEFLVGLVSPARVGAAYAFGLLTLAAAVWGGWRARAVDKAAALVVPYSLVMIALSAYATRQYWTAAWGPMLVTYVPAALWPRADGDQG